MDIWEIMTSMCSRELLRVHWSRFWRGGGGREGEGGRGEGGREGDG